MYIKTEVCTKNAGAQNRGADFVGACAIETHVKILQELLYTEFCRKNAGAQNRASHFVRASAVDTHVKISQEPLFSRNFQVKCSRPE